MPAAPTNRDLEVLLKATSVSKAYGRVTVLDEVDVEFRGGEAHALIREYGAGKSTVVRILAGVVGGGSGSVDIDASVATLSLAQRQLVEIARAMMGTRGC